MWGSRKCCSESFLGFQTSQAYLISTFRWIILNIVNVTIVTAYTYITSLPIIPHQTGLFCIPTVDAVRQISSSRFLQLVLACAVAYENFAFTCRRSPETRVQCKWIQWTSNYVLSWKGTRIGNDSAPVWVSKCFSKNQMQVEVKAVYGMLLKYNLYVQTVWSEQISPVIDGSENLHFNSNGWIHGQHLVWSYNNILGKNGSFHTIRRDQSSKLITTFR